VDLRQLACFLAVADHLHFGRAATSLHQSQASVSEQVRRLELDLGGPLFSRTTRSVGLTPLGELFLPAARTAHDSAVAAYELGRAAARHGDAPLLLGLALDVGQDLLTVALPALAASHPHVRVHPRPLRTGDQIEQLHARRLHLGIAWAPPADSGLSHAVLSTEPYLAFVPSSHPIASRSSLSTDDLRALALVMWSPDLNRWTYDHFIARFGDSPPTVVDQGWGMDAMVPSVLAGRGVGITALSIAAAKQLDGLSLVPIEGHGLPRALIWHPNERHPGLRPTIDALLAAATTP
jgi:DNA-binding transcriptional LysR family regulator